MHIAVIQKYRETLKSAAEKIGLKTPIQHPLDLYVCFINPSSPDLDNLLMALYQALDGKTLRKPALLDDDGLICKVEMMKIFGAKKK
jgi:Holliday junction resolvase RusA-like endonuclease